MQWLNSKYASWFNRRHGRVGHLFQGRFKGILVDSNEYFLEVCRYTVLNPVRAGMVGQAGDYAWSSYRATAGLAPLPDWLSVSPLLGRLRRDPTEARALYQTFVNDGLRVPSPWEKVSGQMYLGGPAFLQFVQGLIDAEQRSDEHPRAMREPGCPSLGEIAEVVADAFETTGDAILTGRGGSARMALAHLGWHRGRLRLGSMAKGLGIRSRGHVSTLVRRAERDAARDPDFRGRLDACRQRLYRPPPVSILAPV